MDAIIQVQPGTWRVEQLANDVGSLTSRLKSLVKGDVPRLVRFLAAAQGGGIPLQVARYAFARDPRELWWAPETVLTRPGAYDCEDYGRLLAALAQATQYDPVAQPEVVRVGAGSYHCVARIRGEVTDLSGYLETGQGLSGLAQLRRFGRDSGFLDI